MVDATWDGYVNANWTTYAGTGPNGPGTNWNGTGVPDGTATFPGNAYQNSININSSATANTSVGTMLFQGGMSYTFGIGVGVFSLTGLGIVNQSVSSDTFTSSGNAELNFKNNSSAGPSFIQLTQNSGLGFFNSSNAGHAIINDQTTNNGGVAFFDQSAASSASSYIDPLSSIIKTAHLITFYNSSSAAGANLHALTGGVISFLGNSYGGASSVVLDTGATLDLSGHNHGDLTFGGISSSGTILLADNSYSIVSAGTSTLGGTITGTGGMGVGFSQVPGIAPGSLPMVFVTSSLQFTGDTTICNGTLEIGSGGSLSGGIGFSVLPMPTTPVSKQQGPVSDAAAASTLPTLKIDATGPFTNTIKNFVAGDGIDLAFRPLTAGDKINWTQTDANTGTLAVVSGGGTPIISLTLTGTHQTSEFSLSSDGKAGTLITSTNASPIATTIQQEVLGLYAALYNRAADYSGEQYWSNFVNQMPDAGGKVSAVNAASTSITTADASALGQAFVQTQSDYFNKTYSGLSDAAFVNALYTNIGGNAGDPNGVAYWTSQLAAAQGSGQNAQTARAGLVGQFVHDLIDFDLTSTPAGLTTAQYQAALLRQAVINDKIATSLGYAILSNSQQGQILVAQSIGDAAYNASVTALSHITSDPGTISVAVTGISNAVTHQTLSSIV